jgi:hypothetical protein
MITVAAITNQGGRMADVRCAGCNKVMQEGDLCIREKASVLIGRPTDPVSDSLIAQIFGGEKMEDIVLCVDCTMEQEDGFAIEVFHT